ncbi:phosphoglycolate phosphatase [Pseudooceanicola sp. CBS1P-1]|uniref:Phosphoglycolate phosphatase n=1 Tax=Pseudooceanicola albus TaxID=2692189 RepID=A0A6L7GBN2_9RHOB|nr:MULTISPECIES: phosphoglycolate phosphatase [Pseudooceanicola]MBT9382863.1 phosphoglycolate phosphatase [Pseudooceanicola endophyticus]MXN20213.1 phosphoglycolate phosphatase [Pseudooceanicola albus]
MARIVFDLDGTLIDSAPDIREAANGLLEDEGLPPLSISETRRFIGEGSPTFVRLMMAARDIEPDRHAPLLAQFLDRLKGAVALTRVYPGAKAALDALAQAGHSLAICTNKPEAPARAVLDHLGLLPRFAEVLGGDSLPQRKPAPEPLLAVLDRLPAGPAIYIGDSEVDAATAEAAGVPFLLFTEGYRKGAVHDMRWQATFADHARLPELIAALV